MTSRTIMCGWWGGMLAGVFGRGKAASETREYGYPPKRTGGHIRSEHFHHDDGVRGPQTRQMRRAESRRKRKISRREDLVELAKRV